MFEIFTEASFSAAHRLVDYPGNCARWHGHNWTVRASVRVDELDALGIGLDLRKLKTVLRERLELLDHHSLNEVPELQGENPSCEVLSRFIFRQLASELNSETVRVWRVDVFETPTSGAAYLGDVAGA